MSSTAGFGTGAINPAIFRLPAPRSISQFFQELAYVGITTSNLWVPPAVLGFAAAFFVMRTRRLNRIALAAYLSHGTIEVSASPDFIRIHDAHLDALYRWSAFIACELAGNPTDACLKAGIAAGAEAVTRIGGQPVAQGPAPL